MSERTIKVLKCIDPGWIIEGWIQKSLVSISENQKVLFDELQEIKDLLKKGGKDELAEKND